MFAHCCDALGFDIGSYIADTIRRLGDNVAPWITNQRVTVGIASLTGLFEWPSLTWSKEIALRFNCPSAAEYIPMIFTSLKGKCRRQYNYISTQRNQLLEKLREANVVADRKAILKAFNIDHRYLCTWRYCTGFAIAHTVRSDDVEQVDFTVATQLVAFGIKNDRGVIDAATVRRAFVEATGVNVDIAVLCQFFTHFISRPPAMRLASCDLLFRCTTRPVKVFRKYNKT
ncbi:hypothetical protein AC138_09225 [Pseudomonas putida]|nr:hypothetical protein AC138_09225 [Pseudomonas putida]